MKIKRKLHKMKDQAGNGLARDGSVHRGGCFFSIYSGKSIGKLFISTKIYYCLGMYITNQKALYH